MVGIESDMVDRSVAAVGRYGRCGMVDVVDHGRCGRYGCCQEGVKGVLILLDSWKQSFDPTL